MSCFTSRSEAFRYVLSSEDRGAAVMYGIRQVDAGADIPLVVNESCVVIAIMNRIEGLDGTADALGRTLTKPEHRRYVGLDRRSRLHPPHPRPPRAARRSRRPPGVHELFPASSPTR